MKFQAHTQILTGLCLLALFWAAPTFADGEQYAEPVELEDNGYRAPVGPPAPRVKKDKVKHDQPEFAWERDKKKRKTKKRSFELQTSTIDIEQLVEAAGGEVNYYHPNDKIDPSAPPQTERTTRRGAALSLGGNSSNLRPVEILVFPDDSLRGRQLDNWDRMGRLPGFSYMENIPSDDAFQFEPGTGPYPNCDHNIDFKQGSGVCPSISAQGTRYLFVAPPDWAGQNQPD